MATQVHLEPADNNWHGTVRSHDDKEEGGVTDVGPVVDAEQNSEPRHGNTDGDQSEEEAVPE